MNEQELRNTVKVGIKSPSDDFTDKVMGDISTLSNEIPVYNKWNIRVLLIACFALFLLSIFVRIPELEFFDYTIEFSPVVAPIITLIFLFVVFQQLYDLRDRMFEERNNKMAYH
jgi:hypothetical protein